MYLSQLYGHIENFYKCISDPEAFPIIQFTQHTFTDHPHELLAGTPRMRKASGKSRSCYSSGEGCRAMWAHCMMSLSADNCFQVPVVRNKRASPASPRGCQPPPELRKYLANRALTSRSWPGPADHTEGLCVPGTWGTD